MRIRKLIKTFTWTNPERETIVLGAGTRLDPATHTAKLEFDPDLFPTKGGFPLTADLFVKSRLTEPKALRSWVGFESTVRHAFDAAGGQLTNTQYRLDPDDGTGEYFWNGAAWVVAGVSDWNTEQDVADNIATFDVATRGQKLRVVVNLVTTDTAATPELIEVKVLMDCVIDFFEDMLYRSIVPLIRSSIRPISRDVIAMPTTGTTFDIAVLRDKQETAYNIVGIDSIFDYDAATTQQQEDLTRGFLGALPDLLDSFADPTVTLIASVTAGDRLFVRFIYEPEIAVNTSQDFVEQAKLPAIVLDDVELVAMSKAKSGIDRVANRGALVAVVVPAPEQGEMRMNLIGMANKQVDHHRLHEQINDFFANTPIVNSTALDEPYRLFLRDEYAEIGEPGQNEVHTGQATFEVSNFRRWLKDPFTENIVAAPTYDGEQQNPLLAFRRQGSNIEGRGPWDIAFSADDAARDWSAMAKYGGTANVAARRYDAFGGAGGPGAGLASYNKASTPLEARAIGPNRVNKALGVFGHARWQLGPDTWAVPVSTLLAFPDLTHWRFIIKDDGTSPAAVQTYGVFFDDVVAFSCGRSGASDLFVDPGPGGLVIAPGIVPIGSWMLIDLNHDNATDLWEVFINGALVATPDSGTPGRTKPKAGAGVILLNSTSTAADNTGITGMFQGLALGRKITLAEHAADAAELGV